MQRGPTQAFMGIGGHTMFAQWYYGESRKGECGKAPGATTWI
ncbi:hypothetical protein PAQ31011_03944 [Pandoraea aquatica]|uniref:Uncharacterized protein n=1 Tax=Pandoraea aquatica TaxID=2508290 RepID=A0A5E4XK40_9BURK|nr:hypothetical protein PAQ31011_03944 [Pandoraea aquatica]